MKVWVVQSGTYEDRDVDGVYSSIEAVMAACDAAPGGWQEYGGDPRILWNGLNGDKSADAALWEVDHGPVDREPVRFAGHDDCEVCEPQQEEGPAPP